MESTLTIFQTMLKENKNNANLYPLITEMSFELARKKLQRLKDEHNIYNRLGELFELYSKALEDEDLKNAKAMSCVIDGLLKALVHEQETFLYKSLY